MQSTTSKFTTLKFTKLNSIKFNTALHHTALSCSAQDSNTMQLAAHKMCVSNYYFENYNIMIIIHNIIFSLMRSMYVKNVNLGYYTIQLNMWKV